MADPYVSVFDTFEIWANGKRRAVEVPRDLPLGQTHKAHDRDCHFEIEKVSDGYMWSLRWDNGQDPR